MVQSLVNINGEIRDAATLTFPATGREYRGAWQLNGDVVEIDMALAREIKIEKIWAKAQERIAKAEEKAAKKAMKGLSTSEEDAEVSKFKAKPKAAGIALIQNAATPEALDAITEDQVYD
jgi:pectin methylesterase-like acyl-CoA thioesterase